MKKVFIIVVMLFFGLGIYNASINFNFVNKVQNELISDYKTMSLDSDGEDILTDEVIVRVKLDYKDFNEVSNIDVSNQEKYRSEAKQYYKSNNEKYLSSINLNNYKSVYVSQYAPYIEYTYKRDKYFNYQNNINNEINENTNIDVASIKNVTINKKEQIRHAMYVSGVSDTFLSYTPYYTGQGIRVGILEVGLVDEEAACFTPGQVYAHIQDTPLESVEDHSTYMAAYIGGCDGIAPDVRLFSSYIWGSPTEEIDWLIDRGVHVINMSYGDSNPTGYYSSDSAYYDLIVNAYKITLVAAVGNFGNSSKLVANPALAYNVIGVGSGNEGGYAESYSSYIEHNGGPKPTIMALGTGIGIPSLQVGNSGTSVACAVTTGIIALLMQQYPELKQNPELVMSALVSTAYQVPGAVLLDNGLSEIAGAGLFRYDQFHYAMRDYEVLPTSVGVLETFIYYRRMFLSSREIFKICLAWTAYSNGNNVNTVSFTNYDLYLYDEYGNLVASSLSTDSNIELLQCYIEEDGEYELRIRQVSFVSKINEKIALTTSIMPRRIDY